ncbi:hypothetical protein ACFQS1_36100 [Paractinoplanes rhizophilus]|uniref:Glycerophosphoryl diester phosphodiesterase membrane domain-containing protein n=1 Tax=Paractinoplanes rhizophilus TaxID=1416877 RepID=A0ABW2I3G9_9ACTN
MSTLILDESGLTLTENPGTSDDDRRPPTGEHPDPAGTPSGPYAQPSDPWAQPPADPPAQSPAGPSAPPPGDPFAQPPAYPFAQPSPGPSTPPPAGPATQPPAAGGAPPSPFGPSQPLPGYGAPPPAGPPSYGPPSYGSPADGPPTYGPPGYGPPGYGPPSHGPQPGYGPPGYPGPAYGQPGPSYGVPATLPPEYYAGPDDALVSPDFAGWWARSFRLLRLAWRPILLIQLIAVLPTAVLLSWVNIASGDQIRRAGTSTLTLDELVDLIVPFLAFIVVVGLLSVTVSLATQRVLVQTATARPASIGAALLDGLRRTPALIGWGILAGLMILVGLVFCILPGIYLLAVFSILPVVVLLERGNAIGRVFQLFHANFGAALGRIAVFLGLNVAFFLVESVFTNALFPGAASGDISTAAAIASELFSAVFSVASAVVLAPMLLTAYADMRARHEPFSTAYLAPAE